MENTFSKTFFREPKIYGDKSNYPTIWKSVRYYLVIATSTLAGLVKLVFFVFYSAIIGCY